MLDKYLLKGDILAALRSAQPEEEEIRLTLQEAFPADIAEILGDLEPPHQLLLLRCMDSEKAGEVLGEAPEDIQKDLLLNLLSRTEVAGILNEIDPDEGADLVGLLPEADGAQALEDVDPEQAEAIRTLATYDPETAGGRMTTEFVTVPPNIPVREAMETLRASLDAESILNVYVVREDETLEGVMSVRDILEASPEDSVSDVMVSEVVFARVDDDQEDASRLLDRYDFTSLPVVDDRKRLLGIITIDDAMDVLEEEAEEDIAAIAGSGMVSARDGAMTHLRHRLPWLLFTLVGGLLAAVLVREYEPTLKAATELVFFMPVLVGMAGNVGIQSATVLVRGFATGEMAMDMAKKTILRQLAVGLMVGGICGVLTGGLAVILTGGQWALGLAVAVSMLVGILCAALAGTLLPIVCQRMKIDPAVASGPVITTMNDLLGLLIYFSVATLVLRYSL